MVTIPQYMSDRDAAKIILDAFRRFGPRHNLISVRTLCAALWRAETRSRKHGMTDILKWAKEAVKRDGENG